MGYNTDGLTFNTLRAGNIRRIPKFKDKQGRICHVPDGSDWSDAQWLQAALGELGEYANLKKKIERGDWALTTQEVIKRELGKELADVVIYLDILAFRLGINLGEAVMNKFNEVSDRIEVDIKIDANGDHGKD